LSRAKRLPAEARKALEASGSLPHIGELVSHFTAAAGGMKKLAHMMLVEYHAARPGSIIRQRILDSILRCTQAANAQLGGAAFELDLLSDEDLEQEALRIFRGIGAGQATLPDDGPPGPTDEPPKDAPPAA
jgi:hypothetical protein